MIVFIIIVVIHSVVFGSRKISLFSALFGGYSQRGRQTNKQLLVQEVTKQRHSSSNCTYQTYFAWSLLYNFLYSHDDDDDDDDIFIYIYHDGGGSGWCVSWTTRPRCNCEHLVRVMILLYVYYI